MISSNDGKNRYKALITITALASARPLTRCYWEIRHGVGIPGALITFTGTGSFPPSLVFVANNDEFNELSYILDSSQQLPKI
jgi:hypothetical protein